ncbi:unnamed protein product [Brassica napus]|uniref:(rape) hypothetical protein n=1 Tax=Brassica napus TaxID=3708 RepID=A0A816JYL0_BRANA|nr:unnamed protein product [Brassica napus]
MCPPEATAKAFHVTVRRLSLLKNLPRVSNLVNEVMEEDIENAGNQFSKALRLLVFLLVEAPMLILNPPSSLTNSDRYRLSRRLKPSAITEKKLRFSGVIISHDEQTTITIWLLLFLLLFFLFFF